MSLVILINNLTLIFSLNNRPAVFIHNRFNTHYAAHIFVLMICSSFLCFVIPYGMIYDVYIAFVIMHNRIMSRRKPFVIFCKNNTAVVCFCFAQSCEWPKCIIGTCHHYCIVGIITTTIIATIIQVIFTIM